MSSILKKLLILLVIACFASKESISSESIKSFFSNSTLNIESSSLEIIDSEKKAIFKGQVKITHDNTYLATDNLILLYSIDEVTSDITVQKITCQGNVLIEYENQMITSLNAIYDAETSQLVFRDEVIIYRDEGNAMQTDKASIDLNTMRMKTGPVKAFITPNNKRERDTTEEVFDELKKGIM